MGGGSFMYVKNMKTNEEKNNEVASTINSESNMVISPSTSNNYSIQYQPFSMNFWGEGPFNDELIVTLDVE